MAVTIEEMAAHFRRREKERQRRAEARACTLIDRLPEAKKLLVERYCARRVILFGSLVRGTPDEGSDVDLAVEGMDTKRYFSAVGDLMGVLGSYVDLVPLEEASPALLASIREDGRDL